MTSIDQTRQEIQQQKELPTLSPDIQRILAACDDVDINQGALADILAESPTIAARILGLANSAFFGQQGRVHSLSHAISVLGMVTVRSVSVGLALSGVFRTGRCPHFHAERYWSSAVMTAMGASLLNPAIPQELRPPSDSVYMAGLLHNIGMLALVHLHPLEMDRAFAAYAADPTRNLAEHIHVELGTDHYQAGIWLGSKWHLPRDLLLVMEYHYVRSYRGEHWPLVLLEGLCASWANRIIDGGELPGGEAVSLAALGLDAHTVEAFWAHMREKQEEVRQLASLLTTV